MEASTSWNPVGLSWPVKGLLYLYLLHYVGRKKAQTSAYISQAQAGPQSVKQVCCLQWLPQIQHQGQSGTAARIFS
jgi:hypothetical protein